MRQLSRTQNTFKAFLRIKVERSGVLQTTAHIPKGKRLAHICLMQIELQAPSVLIKNNAPQNLIEIFFLAGKILVRLSYTRSSKVTSNLK